MWIRNPKSECKRAVRASAQASPRSLEHVCVRVRVLVYLHVCDACVTRVCVFARVRV